MRAILLYRTVQLKFNSTCNKLNSNQALLRWRRWWLGRGGRGRGGVGGVVLLETLRSHVTKYNDNNYHVFPRK